MKLNDKIALAGVIVGLGVLTIGFINLIKNLEDFSIQIIYVWLYTLTIAIAIIMLKIFPNKKLNKSKKHK